MRKYLVTITMPDGSKGAHNGLYESGCVAVIHALTAFPEARRISAKVLP